MTPSSEILAAALSAMCDAHDTMRDELRAATDKLEFVVALNAKLVAECEALRASNETLKALMRVKEKA
jgi:hypothetical protein